MIFEFNNKTYRIVNDVVGELVDGCRKCAFHDDHEACGEVDKLGSGRPECTSSHHYEEVTEPSPT